MTIERLRRLIRNILVAELGCVRSQLANLHYLCRNFHSIGGQQIEQFRKVMCPSENDAAVTKGLLRINLWNFRRTDILVCAAMTGRNACPPDTNSPTYSFTGTKQCFQEFLDRLLGVESDHFIGNR